MLLAGSYYFYSQWDWRFLFILMFSTLLDYFMGFKIHLAEKKSEKLFWMRVSVFINLGILFLFKYFNFFSQSFEEALSQFGITAEFWFLDIILPIGISFYTFHGLSYVLDVYYGRIKPEKSIIDYALFVSFFPLLVAGPIERAQHLLPQIKKQREFTYARAIDGCRQILWGLVKKLIIADNCALYVDYVFGYHDQMNGSSLFIAALLFGVQIYGDFSGYTDIAIGSARLLGFDLLRNFHYPLFSRNIAEFWRRWHISLTSWLRDYVYMPIISRSKRNKSRQAFAILMVFVLSGFWHGANWTFIWWGIINGLLFLPFVYGSKKNLYFGIVAQGRLLPTIKEFFQVAGTLVVIGLTGILFRSTTVSNALVYYKRLFSETLFSLPTPGYYFEIKMTVFLVGIFFIFEWVGRENDYGIQKLGNNWPSVLRWLFYFLLAIAIFYFAVAKKQFIYFQF